MSRKIMKKESGHKWVNRRGGGRLLEHPRRVGGMMARTHPKEGVGKLDQGITQKLYNSHYFIGLVVINSHLVRNKETKYITRKV